ncbi:MAG: hypothetical protein Q9162_001481 [Coniocarpon cinnabarinum]
MTTIALTEHVGRPYEHLYPDEEADGWTPERLRQVFENFVVEAKRLKDQYATTHPEVHLLIGFEGEWIDEDPVEARNRIQEIQRRYAATFDTWIGSVHHVHGIPIDYDAACFDRALTKSGGDEDQLFCKYFDAQYELLTRMEPPVVGHFDLIRLKCREPDKNLRNRQGVWPRILRNLARVKDYNGVLEVNSSALRKGLQHPYPRGEVVTAWTEMGGVVVLSDDSHDPSHAGVCYDKVLKFLQDLDVREVGVIQSGNSENANSKLARMPIGTLAQLPFWASSA